MPTAVIAGKTYNTVIMPDGKEWMAEWLQDTASGLWHGNNAANAWAGRHYTLAEYEALGPYPDGWRVNTKADVDGLFASIPPTAGNAPRTASKEHWQSGSTMWTLATNEYGFNMHPTGKLYGDGWFYLNSWMHWIYGARGDVTGAPNHLPQLEVYMGNNIYAVKTFSGGGDRAVTRLVRDLSPSPSSLAVPAVSVRLFGTPDFLGDAKVFSIPAQEIAAPTEGVRSYLCAQRSGEVVSLVMVPHADISTINGSNITPLWQLEIHDGELHQIGYNNAGDGLPNKQENAQIRTEPYRLAVEGGFAVTLGAGRSLTMDGAEAFFGHRLVDVLPFDSATDTVHEYVHVSGDYHDTRYDGGWVWPNTHFDNGTNLVEMDNNWYGAVFVWRSIGDDREIFVVRGGSQANKLEGARLIPIPEVPTTPAWHCMLIGRILFKKGADTGIFEPYARDSFIRVSVPSLSDLSDVSVSGAAEGDALVLGPAGEWIPFAGDFRVVEIGFDNALAFGSSTDVFDLASITLPAGTWEVEGSLVVYCVQSGLNPVKTLANIGVISENMPFDGWVQFSGSGEGGQTVSVTVPRRRFEYATPFTVYLCGQERFGEFTDGVAWGNLTARRVK